MKGKRNRGFTLIELVFVVFLIALLSAVLAPRFSRMSGSNLRMGSMRLSSYLRNAYERSALRHQRIRVRFDFNKRVYWAEEYSEPQPEPLINDETKIDEVIEKFEDLAQEPELTPEEKLAELSKRYERVKEGMLKPGHLPDGVLFKRVFTDGEERNPEKDAPWIEFSPGGYTQEAIVNLMQETDENDVTSVILPALGGRARVERGEILPRDV